MYHSPITYFAITTMSIWQILNANEKLGSKFIISCATTGGNLPDLLWSYGDSLQKVSDNLDKYLKLKDVMGIYWIISVTNPQLAWSSVRWIKRGFSVQQSCCKGTDTARGWHHVFNGMILTTMEAKLGYSSGSGGPNLTNLLGMGLARRFLFVLPFIFAKHGTQLVNDEVVYHQQTIVFGASWS